MPAQEPRTVGSAPLGFQLAAPTGFPVVDRAPVVVEASVERARDPVERRSADLDRGDARLAGLWRAGGLDAEELCRLRADGGPA